MDRILIAESNTELASQLRGVFADANNYPMSCDTIKKTRTMLECEEWALVLVDGYPLGWGKLSNGVLKNKYLPGWRLT